MCDAAVDHRASKDLGSVSTRYEEQKMIMVDICSLKLHVFRIDEYWKRHISQFNSLCEEYQTDPTTLLYDFGHSLQRKSQAYHYCQFVIKDEMITFELSCNAFDKRYHSDTKKQ